MEMPGSNFESAGCEFESRRRRFFKNKSREIFQVFNSTFLAVNIITGILNPHAAPGKPVIYARAPLSNPLLT